MSLFIRFFFFCKIVIEREINDINSTYIVIQAENKQYWMSLVKLKRKKLENLIHQLHV